MSCHRELFFRLAKNPQRQREAAEAQRHGDHKMLSVSLALHPTGQSECLGVHASASLVRLIPGADSL